VFAAWRQPTAELSEKALGSFSFAVRAKPRDRPGRPAHQAPKPRIARTTTALFTRAAHRGRPRKGAIDLYP